MVDFLIFTLPGPLFPGTVQGQSFRDARKPGTCPLVMLGCCLSRCQWLHRGIRLSGGAGCNRLVTTCFGWSENQKNTFKIINMDLKTVQMGLGQNLGILWSFSWRKPHLWEWHLLMIQLIPHVLNVKSTFLLLFSSHSPSQSPFYISQLNLHYLNLIFWFGFLTIHSWMWHPATPCWSWTRYPLGICYSLRTGTWPI